MHLHGKKLGIFHKIILRSVSSEIDFKREILLLLWTNVLLKII